MQLAEFLENNEKRLKSYIKRFIRLNRLPGHIFDDLWQTAIISLLGTLPYWKADLGTDGQKQIASRSAFNFVCPALLKAFRRECKDWLRGAVLLEEPQKLEKCTTSSKSSDSAAQLALAIDLRRTLEKDPKPAQVVRFIAHALSPASGGDLARLDGLSRQAFYKRRKFVQARLISNLA